MTENKNVFEHFSIKRMFSIQIKIKRKKYFQHFSRKKLGKFSTKSKFKKKKILKMIGNKKRLKNFL